MSVEASAAENGTYGQILRSTALIGGSSVVNVAFGIVRAKAMAVLLGPAGVGLIGLYSSIADLFTILAGVGIPGSGVRQIAAAAGSGDAEAVARAATALKWASVLLGLVGGLVLFAFALPVSMFTFGDHGEAAGVALLGAAVVLRVVSAGQVSLVQGLRRISDLARLNMLAALFSTLISIPLVYFLGERGIALSLVGMAATSLLTSWWYSRKVRIVAPSMAWSQIGHETAALLKLGLAFLASGLLTVGAAYAVRIIVLREAGVEAAGLYQAAWALGGVYVAFILQAMGADFYPRLTGVSKDDERCNRLVNEQAQISMLLAAPGVIATLTFAPLVVTVFYTAEFQPAVSLLRWICLGMMLRIVAWPMGFIVLAKGAQRIFFWTEVAATLVHVGLAWLLVATVGLDGAGAAFFGLYVWHSVLIYFVVRRLSGFRWSTANVKLGVAFLSLTGLVFGAFQLLSFWQATALGMTAVVASGVYSLWALLALLGPEPFPRAIRPWLPTTSRGRPAG